MQFSMKQILASEAYQTQAQLWAKSKITVSVICMAYLMIWGETSLGLHWLWIVPLMIVFVSLFIALPTMLVNVWLAATLSKQMKFQSDGTIAPKGFISRTLGIIKSSWGLASICISIWLTSVVIMAISELLH